MVIIYTRLGGGEEGRGGRQFSPGRRLAAGSSPSVSLDFSSKVKQLRRKKATAHNVRRWCLFYGVIAQPYLSSATVCSTVNSAKAPPKVSSVTINSFAVLISQAVLPLS